MCKYVLKITSGGDFLDKMNELFLYLYRITTTDKEALLQILERQRWKEAYIGVDYGNFVWITTNTNVPSSAKSLPMKEIAGSEKQRIFFDLDGTVAEWQSGKSLEEVFSDGYFRNLPVMDSVRNAIRIINENPCFDCRILSAYNPEYSYILPDKKAWIRKELPFLKESQCFFSVYGQSKIDYVPFPKKNDVLVDDYNKNLREWHGIPIKMLNQVNSIWDGRIVSHQMDGTLLANSIQSLAQI